MFILNFAYYLLNTKRNRLILKTSIVVPIYVGWLLYNFDPHKEDQLKAALNRFECFTFCLIIFKEIRI